jgi:acetyl-CoA decarbonylase/synthase complex subunit gamma
MPTAMEIYKLLPKKNCGECKVPTCLAFAMQLANQKTSLEACPYISPEAKTALEESGAPPIRMVTVGAGELALKMGDETQLFRHDKTFYHPTGIAFVADDSLGLAQMKATIDSAKASVFERVGQMLRVDAVAIRHSSGAGSDLLEAVKHALSVDIPMVLMVEDPTLMAEAAKLASDKKPLLYRATSANFDAMVTVAKETSSPLVIGGVASLDELAQLADKAKKAGLNDLVLEPSASSAGEMLSVMTGIRRAAVKSKYRPLGFPTLAVLDGAKDDGFRMALGVLKYASVLLVENIGPDLLYPIIALRQNIFTDPQVPIQVKPGLYSVGDPTDKSPLLFTTNFSLTYFTVRADVEKSKLPVWLLVVDTEGQSVMTSFAAGKLTPESVAKLIESAGIKEKSARNEIVIPGMVSRMSGKLNELTGMKVVVGPRESSGLPKMLKTISQ